MQRIPSDVLPPSFRRKQRESQLLDEIFDLIDAIETQAKIRDSCENSRRLRVPAALSKLTDNELALTLFPECRDWLEENHRYDHTPEMYISAYFNRTNDLEYQYRMVRYMELRPTGANKDIVNAWYKELRKKRSNSFDNKPILPGVPDYPVFASCT